MEQKNNLLERKKDITSKIEKLRADLKEEKDQNRRALLSKNKDSLQQEIEEVKKFIKLVEVQFIDTKMKIKTEIRKFKI